MPTEISWTDETWNPIAGCSKVSAGCKGCYAIKDAHRLAGNPNPKIRAKYAGTTTEDGKNWTGRVNFAEHALNQPLRWKRPRRIFVNSMSDLFHESIPDEWIDRIFAVMALAPQHTFQVLTKRPERMREYMSRDIEDRLDDICHEMPGSLNETWHYPAEWPLRNCWLGVSVEDQKTADERIPLLLETPAAVRWISAEPLLSLIDLGWYFEEARWDSIGRAVASHTLDWVVTGAESGTRARPFDLAWARSIVEQCKAARTACFVKQVGTRPVDHGRSLRPENQSLAKQTARYVIHDKKGGDPSEWPLDLRVREFPEVTNGTR